VAAGHVGERTAPVERGAGLERDRRVDPHTPDQVTGGDLDAVDLSSGGHRSPPQSRRGGRTPRNSQSPPIAVDTTSSEEDGCAPTSSRIGVGPVTIRLVSAPSPSTSTVTTSPGCTGRELAGVPDRITSPGTS